MKKIFLLSFILILSVASQGQELILSEETITESYLLRYDNSNDQSQQVINFMINEIGKFSKHNRQNDQVVFSYKQSTRITRKDKQINIFLNIKDFKSESNVNYRGFELIDVMIPSKIDMSCQLTTKTNQLLANYSVDAAEFNSEKNQFSFNYIDTNNTKEFKFIVKSKKLSYNNHAKSDFINKLSDIDKYYDVGAKMSMAFDDMSTINPDNIERLFDYDNMLKNIEHLIVDVESYRLDQKLNLREFDPSHVHQKLQDLKFESNRQRGIVNHTISILYQIYYNRALEALVNGNEVLAVGLFEKSLYNNPLFAPAQLQLAKIDYKNNKLDEAAAKLKDIYFRMKPDPETGSLCMELVNNLYNSYLDKGEALLNSKSFQPALDVFYKTRDFCRSFPGFYCSELLSTDIINAKHGIYVNYLDGARQYLMNGDLTTAEKEVQKANDYFNSNQTDLKSNSEAIGLLTEIKNQEYSKLITQGKIQLKAKNYQASFKTFQMAEALENQYNINKSEELRALLSQSAKPVILSDVANGLLMVKQNKIDDAKNIVMSAFNTQSSYNLSADKDINKQMEELRKKIFTQECINAQNEYDVYLGNAKVNVSNKYYLLADKDFDKAFNVADNNPNCMIDKTDAMSLKNEVQAAIDFLKKSIDIDNDVKLNRYSNAITAYIEIEKFYSQQQIDKRYALSLLPMFDFIAKQSNSFIIYTINYYITAKNYENALKLLDVLKSRTTNAKLIKNEQKLLGTQLAIRDFATNPSQDSKVAVLQYTRADKWYKVLSAAYLKQWKKIR